MIIVKHHLYILYGILDYCGSGYYHVYGIYYGYVIYYGSGFYYGYGYYYGYGVYYKCLHYLI